MSNLFQTLELEAFRKGINPRTKQSREWFRRKASALRRVNRNQLMKEDPLQLKTRFEPGAMAMFFYDPKTKDKLPYYDSFPLVIVVDAAPNGFYGLNLHYLPPTLRAKFLDGLMDRLTDRTMDEKHYLTSNVRSKFAVVPAPEWEIATFLPTADWQKGSGSQVYKDSRNMI
jgi:hypothetical protein